MKKTKLRPGIAEDNQLQQSSGAPVAPPQVMQIYDEYAASTRTLINGNASKSSKWNAQNAKGLKLSRSTPSLILGASNRQGYQDTNFSSALKFGLPQQQVNWGISH